MLQITYQIYYQLLQHPRTLRSANKYKQLVIPKIKRKTFSIMAPLLWNGLPEPLHRANNVETFKAELKTLLFRRYYM